MIKNKLVAKPLTKQSCVKAQNSNIFQLVNKIKEAVNKEQLIQSSSKILLSISGGQDSIFLLFCLSFLQSQLNFCFKIVWCNHFWQSNSFYTTLHLTKSAQAFSSPIIGFVPLGFATRALPSTKRCFVSAMLPLLPSTCFPTPPPVRLQIFDLQAHRVILRSKTRVLLRSKTKVALGALTKRLTKRSFVLVRHFLDEKAKLEVLHIKKTKRGTSFAAYTDFDTQNRVLRGKINSNKIFCFPKEREQNIILLNTPLKKQKKFIEAISEDTARNWRHITIERSYAFYNMNRCVYGHTLSDRVETILFNLIRGTGSRGASLLALKREHASFCYNKFFPCLEQLKKNTHLNNL